MPQLNECLWKGSKVGLMAHGDIWEQWGDEKSWQLSFNFKNSTWLWVFVFWLLYHPFVQILIFARFFGLFHVTKCFLPIYKTIWGFIQTDKAMFGIKSRGKYSFVNSKKIHVNSFEVFFFPMNQSFWNTCLSVYNFKVGRYSF